MPFSLAFARLFLLAIMLLFFYIKFIRLKKSEDNLNKYFLNLNRKKINTFIISVYVFSQIISLEVIYILLNIFNIIKPLLLTIIIGIVSSIITFLDIKNIEK